MSLHLDVTIRPTRPIVTTRVARCLADIDAQWAIVARQMFAGRMPDLRWVWEGRFANGDFSGFSMARASGLITTVQGRGADGCVVLYAKIANRNSRLRNSE